jgi:cobalt-zinc-cadmium resistance protein CzcA
MSALLLSLTLIPVLAYLGLKRAEGHHEPWLMRQIGPRYHSLLEKAFANRRLVSGIAVASLVVAGGAYTITGKTFLPTMDEGSTLVQLAKYPSISIDHSLEGDLKVQRAILAQVPEVTDIIARVGSDELGLDPMSPNETDSFMRQKPREEWRVQDKDWLVEEIRKVMDDLPGIEPSFTQPIEMRISEMLTGARGDLAIKLFGPDLKELSRISGEIQGRLQKIEGTTEAMTVANDTVDYLQIDIDRLAAGRAGMPVDMLQDMMRADVEGVRAGVVADGNRRVPIVIKGAGSEGIDPASFTDQIYRAPSGQLVRTSDVATVAQIAGPVKLEHENGSRFALVQAFVSGRDLVGYVEEAKADIGTNVKLPPGYRIVWG